jgi:hypothetical protein
MPRRPRYLAVPIHKMGPKVSRDGRFSWDDASQSWQPMPAHLQPQPRQHKEKRKGGVFISTGTIILIIMAYLVLHHVKYAVCALQPDLQLAGSLPRLPPLRGSVHKWRGDRAMSDALSWRSGYCEETPADLLRSQEALDATTFTPSRKRKSPTATGLTTEERRSAQPLRNGGPPPALKDSAGGSTPLPRGPSFSLGF